MATETTTLKGFISVPIINSFRSLKKMTFFILKYLFFSYKDKENNNSFNENNRYSTKRIIE